MKPSTLVLAFTGTGLVRTSLSVVESKAKPYFIPRGKGLALTNVPVPLASPSSLLAGTKKVLGYSLLADSVMRGLDAGEFWYGDVAQNGVDGGLVSCRLMERFAHLAQTLKARALVVGLVENDGEVDPARDAVFHKRVDAALTCASRAGLATLDTYRGFEHADVIHDLQSFYRHQHFTDRGNRLAAQMVADALAAAGM